MLHYFININKLKLIYDCTKIEIYLWIFLFLLSATIFYQMFSILSVFKLIAQTNFPTKKKKRHDRNMSIIAHINFPKKKKAHETSRANNPIT